MGKDTLDDITARVVREINEGKSLGATGDSENSPFVPTRYPGSSLAGATGDPKREAGSRKPSYMNRSLIARALVSYVMETGAKKYGAYNWVAHPMRASTYYDAINRHMELWLDGQEVDEESNVTHLAHVIACCEILIEQQALSKLIDDRPRGLSSLSHTYETLTQMKVDKQG